MALLFVDGMDDYTATADIVNKWTTADAAWTYSSGTGVDGRDALTCVEDDKPLTKVLRLPGTTENIIRVFFKFKSSTPPAAEDLVMMLMDTNNGREHRCWINTSGFISTSNSYQNTGSGTKYYGTTNVCDGSWHTIEYYFKTSDTGADGALHLYVDGVKEVDRNSVNTWSIGSVETVDHFDEVRFYAPDSDGFLDDVIIWDDNGSDFTGAIAGQHSLVPLLPNAAGDSSDFTPTGGANYTNVDEVGAPDDDTTTVSSETVGDLDLYNLENMTGTTNSIHSVFVEAWVRAETGASTDIKLKVKTGTTEGDGVTKTINGSTYKQIVDIFTLDPDTGVAWTETGVNGMQAGIEIT